MYKWNIEFIDQKTKVLQNDVTFYKQFQYYRVSLTLPCEDRFIGEGSTLLTAQKNAALNCLSLHPVLRLGEHSVTSVDYLTKFTTLIEKLPADYKFDIISGQADCPMNKGLIDVIVRG